MEYGVDPSWRKRKKRAWDDERSAVRVENCWLQTEKWVKHYASFHQILLVGEGDFSFSLSLALGFGSASNIWATSLNPCEELLKMYQGAETNLIQLRQLGATLLHEVDATKMKDDTRLVDKKFDCIIFNFPHAGFFRKEDNPLLIEMHKDLLRGFFSNARCLLKLIGQVHVSHKTSAPYCEWNLEALAYENGLYLIEDVPFNIADYRYYQNKRGHGPRCDEPFKLGDCSTFKFGTPSHFTMFSDHPDYLVLRDGLSHKNIQSAPNQYNRDLLIRNATSASIYRPSWQFSELETSRPLLNGQEPLPQFKFIVKGLGDHYSCAAGYGGALKTPGNSTIAIIFGSLLHFDPDVAELLSIKHALLMFERSVFCGKVSLVVESDSTIAISWIKSDIGNPLEVQPVVKDITSIISRIGDVHICYRCSYGEHGDGTYRYVYDLAKDGMRTSTPATEILIDKMPQELWFHSR